MSPKTQYNISLEGVQISIKVDPKSDAFTGDEIIDFVLAVYAEAWKAEREQDRLAKEHWEKEEGEDDKRELSNKIQTEMKDKGLTSLERAQLSIFGNAFSVDPEDVIPPKERTGVSIDCLLDKECVQDLFLLESKYFIGFLAESLNRAISFLTPKDVTQNGYYPDELVSILVDHNDAIIAQRILDALKEQEGRPQLPQQVESIPGRKKNQEKRRAKAWAGLHQRKKG